MGYKSFKDLLGYEETLFKEDRVFDLDYIPENFIHRDAQMQSIALCLLPALKGGRAINALIVGPSATGKTTAVKLRFQELEEESTRVVCVHINCQITDTKFGVFSQIHKKLFGYLPPETGVPFSRIYEAIFKKLIKDEKSLVVALDDINYLFYGRQGNEILYDLLRAHELFPEVKTSGFGIVSDSAMTLKLDPRVSSIFSYREIFFQPYSRAEMYDILKNRAKLGFFPGVIEDELIEKIASYAFEHGDLRVGIELLRVSGIIAEAEASRKILDKHVEKAYENSKLVNMKLLISSLSKSEKTLLRLIADSEEPISGEIYQKFKEKTKLSYTKFYRLIAKLEDLKLIETSFSAPGRGRSRKIILRHPKEDLLRFL